MDAKICNSDEDIVSFLASRYGIRVTKDFVRSTVLKGFDRDSLDLMELMTIILIPTLIKAANQVIDQAEDSKRLVSNKSKELQVVKDLEEVFDPEKALEEVFDPEIIEETVEDVEKCAKPVMAKSVEDGHKSYMVEMVKDLEDGEEPENFNYAVKGIPIDVNSKNKQNFEKNINDLSSTNLVQPPEGLLQNVLNMVLHDAMDSIQPPLLDKKLLSAILESYGEIELSKNDGLLEEMVNCAVGSGGLLDVQSFARALTHDVQLYDVASENSPTSRLTDALSTLKVTNTGEMAQQCCCFGICASKCKHSFLTENVQKINTAETIDSVADTSGSKILPVFVWAAFIIFYFQVRNEFRRPNGCAIMSEDNIVEDFGCQVLDQIISWIITVLTIA